MYNLLKRMFFYVELRRRKMTNEQKEILKALTNAREKETTKMLEDFAKILEYFYNSNSSDEKEIIMNEYNQFSKKVFQEIENEKN